MDIITMADMLVWLVLYTWSSEHQRRRDAQYIATLERLIAQHEVQEARLLEVITLHDDRHHAE